jgi:hypothetical protein
MQASRTSGRRGRSSEKVSGPAQEDLTVPGALLVQVEVHPTRIVQEEATLKVFKFIVKQKICAWWAQLRTPLAIYP